ncbi:MAG: hypothetical protein Q8933_09425 [Bacteroidota bacterium]|nr:hypothetical protein [Bacteroidota bacterium]
MEAVKIEYDRFGRMNYNPEFHANNGKLWGKEDVQYMIDWYNIIGPEEMSYALERTIKTIQAKATELRRKGLLTKPAKQMHHKRIKKGCLSNQN